VELVLDPVVGCVVVFQKNAVVVLASSRCWFLTHGTGRWRVGRNRPLLDFTGNAVDPATVDSLTNTWS